MPLYAYQKADGISSRSFYRSLKKIEDLFELYLYREIRNIFNQYNNAHYCEWTDFRRAYLFLLKWKGQSWQCAVVYCLLLGAWHQNIGKKAVKWRVREREKNYQKKPLGF